MINIEKFREQGYLYDSIKNYSDFINFEEFKKIKEEIDLINIKRHSRYDYWFKYKGQSYMEQLVYDELLKNDKDLDTADYVYQKGHEYQLKKIEESEFYPTWIFGTNLDNKIMNLINSETIKEFQKKFCDYYYSDIVNENTKYQPSLRLQFYDKGCEIKLHDDGKSVNRICVFLYFLNDNWNSENGGELVLYTKENQSIKINPVFPNLVVLDSDMNLFHEVLKVKNDMKYNIVCFLGYENG